MRRCTCTIMCTTRPGLTIDPPLAEGANEDRWELLHVDRAGHGAAAEAQLLGGGVVVNAAADVDGKVAWSSIGSDQNAVAFADLGFAVSRGHRCTSGEGMID